MEVEYGLNIHFGLAGSYGLRIREYVDEDIMLRFDTARLNGIDAKYATYSFVQVFMILARSDRLKRATERMNKVDIDLLREQHAQFRHLRAPEDENGGRSPGTLEEYGKIWIEIYPLVGALEEEADESQAKNTPDSEDEDA